MTWLLPMAIILPITGAALTLVASRRPRVQRVISVTTIAIQLLVEIILLLQVQSDGPMVMHIGGWTAPLGVTLVADGLSNPDIAARLFISVRTAQGHVENILRKLGMRDRVELVRYAIRRGLVEP